MCYFHLNLNHLNFYRLNFYDPFKVSITIIL